jgi:beta-lactamase regulating signal transducer with metallopeptidase domain
MIALLVKVTLLFGAGALAATLLRRSPAALRHVLWTLTLGGAVALTLSAPLVPTLPVELRGWRAPVWQVVAASPGVGPSVNPDAGTVSVGEAAPPVAASRLPVRAPRSTFRLDPAATVFAIWLLGVVMVLGWYLLGHARLAVLVRRGVPVSGDEWTALIRSVADASGVGAPVRVLRSDAVGSPITWGIRRPIVLLPADAEEWTTDRRRVVLSHELGHAARGDAMAQLIGCVACAIYWFHPLAWMSARRLRVESERACDDHVLSRGIPGVEYAAHLLDVARRSGAMRLTGMVAIGMARPSHLEGRLLAVLDQGRARQAPARRTRIAAWAGTACLVVPLAAFRPVAATEAAKNDVRIEGVASSEERSDGDRFPPRASLLAVGEQKGDSVFERSIAASNGETLELDLESGGSINVSGWDRPTVQVKVILAGPDWRDSRVSLTRSGRSVRLHERPETRRNSSSTSHHYEIKVPRKFDLSFNTAGGDVTIADLEGVFVGSTGGGGYAIERAGGRAELTTGGGDIRVSDSDLSGSISTGGGTVMLSRVRGGLKGSSGSGPVIRTDVGAGITGDLSELRIHKDGIHVGGSGKSGARSGVLHIDKAGGSIVLDRVPDGAVLQTGGGEIRVGRSAGVIKATTGGGNIEIGPVTGSVSAVTGAGAVRISISEVGDDDRLIDVSSGNGEVVLELPANLSARFELETAYTRNFGRRTEIETAWDLERSETSEWDSQGGTPRKYVRATGSVGRRGPLIRVRTVNGNITVMRRAN